MSAIRDNSIDPNSNSAGYCSHDTPFYLHCPECAHESEQIRAGLSGPLCTDCLSTKADQDGKVIHKRGCSAEVYYRASR